MAKILREPTAAAAQKYDLIIIGGGIYGAMLSLEASRRGLRSLLLERGDFGGATSFNSLRIIHGGLRYLQKMDLRRFRESVRERKWFLQAFPNLVVPLPCLMPLYGNGLKRPSLLRFALRANDLLSYRRNQDVDPNRHLPSGQIIDPDQTRNIYPEVEMKGLQGGAVWFDAFIPHAQRLLIEILRWSCEYGGTALNYVEASELLQSKQRVLGVAATDNETGRTYEYKSRIVVNATGPWCRDLAAYFDRDEPRLFRSSIAWNVLLNREPLSEYALAVTPGKESKEQVYFFIPWKGKVLAGTGHSPWQGNSEQPMPSSEALEGFLNDLNLAIPSLNIDEGDILHIFAGLLPVTRTGTVKLTTREVIVDHAEHDGPSGLYSISGVKFTTSRSVAEKTLHRIFPEKKLNSDSDLKDFNLPPDSRDERGIFDGNWLPLADESACKAMLGSLLKEEAVQHLDDLVVRRTDLWNDPPSALQVAPTICKLFDWDQQRRRQEIAKLKDKFAFFHNYQKPQQTNVTSGEALWH